MKKKILIIASVLMIGAGTAAFAQTSNFGIGLNLGTNTGVALDFGPFFTNVGFDFYGMGVGEYTGVDVDLGWDFEVYRFHFGPGSMPISIGPMVPIFVGGGNNRFFLGTGAMFEAVAEYQFDNVPLGIYLRLAGGLGLDISDFWNGGGNPLRGLFNGAIGAKWYL